MIPQKFGARRLFDLGGGEHKTPFLVERFEEGDDPCGGTFQVFRSGTVLYGFCRNIRPQHLLRSGGTLWPGMCRRTGRLPLLGYWQICFRFICSGALLLSASIPAAAAAGLMFVWSIPHAPVRPLIPFASRHWR